MLIKMFKSKIHRATITGADLNYEGSIKISGDLLDAANMYEYESIWVWNCNNGERLMTYIIRGPENTGVIELNGAAARLGHAGDLVILTTFCDLSLEEVANHQPTVVMVDKNNKITGRFNQSGGIDNVK